MVHRLLTEVLSRCRALALGCSGFKSCDAQAAEHGLKSCPATPWPVGSSQVREWTRVSWTGRRIPHHWAARGALAFFLKEFHHMCRENSLCQGARFWKSTKFFQLKKKATFPGSIAIIYTCLSCFSWITRFLVAFLFSGGGVGASFFFFNWRLITLQYCSGFATHWHESAMGVPVSPILNPPSHLPPHPTPLGHPSAPALSALSHASNLDWRSVFLVAFQERVIKMVYNLLERPKAIEVHWQSSG